jgi:hypothetical protein
MARQKSFKQWLNSGYPDRQEPAPIRQDRTVDNSGTPREPARSISALVDEAMDTNAMGPALGRKRK